MTTYTNQDRITLKGIKYFAGMSEETHCFTATIYFDGVKVGTTKNNGHGGCDEDWPTNKPGWADMLAYVSSFEADQSSFADGVTILQPDLDWVVSELVNSWLALDELKKLVKKRVVFVRDGKVLQTQCAKGKAAQKRVTLARWIHELETDNSVSAILNQLPIADALKLYKELI